MTLPPIEVDYLVVGAGATAMAFVDTLLSESDATVAMVDRHHQPGGHWNHAYPFVRLHQASALYGVSSRELGARTRDQTGLNRGLYSLASGAEVLAYFDEVMRERFLPSGRVLWLPMSDYSAGEGGAHRITSMTSGRSRAAIVRRKLVDATLAQTAVPATDAPKYAVAPGVACIPVNGLPEIRRPYANYTVVGSGKTGMDACLWLLQNGVEPERIRWIMPRDAWWMNRANVQPGAEDFERNIGATLGQFDAIIEATSVADLFARLEARGLLLRLDPAVQPSAYRCAVVSEAERSELRRIRDVVRRGRVLSIEPRRLDLAQGSLTADLDTLYIDCSASGLVRPPLIPVFEGDRIHLLMVRSCQPLFSAALTAYVESHVEDPAEKNALCTVVPSPERPLDWLRMWHATLANNARWREHAGVSAWLSKCRLNITTAILRGVDLNDPVKKARLQESQAKAAAAAAKLPQLLASAV